MVQYGAGSLTGGFSVLLGIDDDADTEQVVAAYVAAAGSRTPPPQSRTVRSGTATVTWYQPDGDAGGYQGDLVAVDEDAGSDYVYYSQVND